MESDRRMGWCWLMHIIYVSGKARPKTMYPNICNVEMPYSLSEFIRHSNCRLAVVNTFEPQRRIVLITEYLSHVKELKSWHLSFLRTLIDTKTDITTNDKLVQLLFEKAVDFAKDKNFGKFVLSFIKSNIKFSDEQK